MLFRTGFLLLPAVVIASLYFLRTENAVPKLLFSGVVAVSFALLMIMLLLALWRGWTGLKQAGITILCASFMTLAGFFIAAKADQAFQYWHLDPDQVYFWEGEIVDLQVGSRFGQRFKVKINCVGTGPKVCDVYQSFGIWPVFALINTSTKQAWKAHPGESWRFQAQSKSAQKAHAPWSFNRSRWLFSQHIVAQLKLVDVGWARSTRQSGFGLQWLRHQFSVYIQQVQMDAQPDTDALAPHGVLLALVNGNRALMTDAHWRLFNSTGTSHLVAISGLHIGMVAGFVGLLGFQFFRRCLWLTHARAAKVYGVVPALLAAGIYAGLAGFALPTQRALIMLTVYGLILLLGGVQQLWSAWGLALFLVVLWDPASTLGMGFWLSFGAVFVILWSAGSRPIKSSGWRRWLQVQWALFLGLMPILIWQTQAVSMVSPLANVLAVPWVTLVVVPLALVWAVVWMAFGSVAAEGLLDGVLLAVDGLLWLLIQCNSLPGAVWNVHTLGIYSVLLALVGVAWWLTAGLPGRCFAPLLLIPLLGVSKPLEGLYLWAPTATPRILLHERDRTLVIAKAYWPQLLPRWQQDMLRYWGVGMTPETMDFKQTGALWLTDSWVLTRIEHPANIFGQRKVKQVIYENLCETEPARSDLMIRVFKHPRYQRHCAVQWQFLQQRWLLWPGSSSRSDQYLVEHFRQPLQSEYLVLLNQTKNRFAPADLVLPGGATTVIQLTAADPGAEVPPICPACEQVGLGRGDYLYFPGKLYP